MMIDWIAASNVEPLGNPNLEIEYLISRKLLGYNYSDSYIYYRWLLSTLPMIHLMGDKTYTKEINKFYENITSSNSDLLDDSAVKDLYEGKGQDLKILKNLLTKTQTYLPYLTSENDKLKEEEFDRRMNSFEGLYQYDTATLVDAMPQEDNNPLDSLVGSMKKFMLKAENLIRLSGSDEPIYVKVKVPESFEAIPFWLNSLIHELNYSENHTPGYMLALSNVLNSLKSTYPIDTLDPFERDQYLNGLETLREPKNYYRMLKSEEILSLNVAQAFSLLYPGFHEKIMDLSINAMSSSDYQESINAKASCAIQEDTAELSNLCQKAIYKGYTGL